MHKFTPSDGLHIVLDYAEPGMPFVTTCDHHYENTITNITVPAGTRTDFASVPWFFRRLFPQVGGYSRAALFHDQLYIEGKVSRAQADAIFLALMEHDDVPPWPRWPIYLAVRCFGWIPWNRRHGRST
ncbi:MAG: DUF1353 domain-containing protein [Planctomycetota bacterium]